MTSKRSFRTAGIDQPSGGTPLVRSKLKSEARARGQRVLDGFAGVLAKGGPEMGGPEAMLKVFETVLAEMNVSMVALIA